MSRLSDRVLHIKAGKRRLMYEANPTLRTTLAVMKALGIELTAKVSAIA